MTEQNAKEQILDVFDKAHKEWNKKNNWGNDHSRPKEAIKARRELDILTNIKIDFLINSNSPLIGCTSKD